VTGRAGQKAAGCLLLNDSKYGHSLDGSTLRLTLIRSAYEPDILPEIGQHEIHLAVCPFGGDLPVARAIRAGQEFNHPVRVVGTDVHKGNLPAGGRFIRLESAGAVLTAIKKAEDGDGLIVRLFNPTAKKQTVRLSLEAGLLPAVAKAEEVDLMERPVGQSAVRLSGRTVIAALPARGITSLRLEMK
jgi:alpha-mannosidase